MDDSKPLNVSSNIQSVWPPPDLAQDNWPDRLGAVTFEPVTLVDGDVISITSQIQAG